MKRFFLVISVVLLTVLCFENRAALLISFVHDGMTDSDVVRLLGEPADGKGYIVGGHVGTSPKPHIWYYRYCLLGYCFGTLPVRFQGAQPMLTRKA